MQLWQCDGVSVLPSTFLPPVRLPDVCLPQVFRPILRHHVTPPIGIPYRLNPQPKFPNHKTLHPCTPQYSTLNQNQKYCPTCTSRATLLHPTCALIHPHSSLPLRTTLLATCTQLTCHFLHLLPLITLPFRSLLPRPYARVVASRQQLPTARVPRQHLDVSCVPLLDVHALKLVRPHHLPDPYGFVPPARGDVWPRWGPCNRLDLVLVPLECGHLMEIWRAV